MKNILSIVISMLILFSTAQTSLYSQQRVIEGIVSNGKAYLSGVSIYLKDTNISSSTDIDGRFRIEAKIGQTLVFSMVGYTTEERTITGFDKMNILLKENVSELDEVVVVGYGTQKKSNLTGSVSTIKSDKLTIAPITNVTNALAGQLPGLKTKQISGIPGSDGSQLSIRGFSSPLVIVDGVETSFSNIDPSQIESISILKDGAASIYGARAGNGVVLVTLKRGTISDIKATVNSSTTLQNSTQSIKAGNSGQRSEWEREAHINGGLPPSLLPWTLSEIEKFYDGSDPNYINTDWFSAVIRPWAPQQNHNVSLNGGTNKINFFSYLGYNKQETISKNDGGYYQRLNFQTTIDSELAKGLKLSSSFNYIYDNRDFTSINLGHSNYYFALYDSDPRYPLEFPDPTKLAYANSSYGNALFVSSRELAGYRKNFVHNLRINGAITYDIPNLEGLRLKAFINYNGDNSLSKIFRKQPSFYSYNENTDTYNFERKSQDATMLYYGAGFNNDLTQQYSVSYEKVYNNVHSVSGLLLHERINYNSTGFDTQRGDYTSSVIDQFFAGDPTTASNNSSASEMGRVSYLGRFNYGYKSKYLLEAIFRADASAKFPKDGRWGYFPSISLGWVASEESFLSKYSFVDNLKLRTSYGQSGDDGIGNYQYFAGYSYDMAYILDDKIYQGLYATGLSNPNLSWERLSIYNVGIDYSFLKRKVFGNIEAFYRLRDGIPGYRTKSLPSTFGAALPLENMNSIDTRGFEFELGTAGTIGNLGYNVTGNIAWARSKWVNYDEPDYEDEDQKRIFGVKGKWTDTRFGYRSDGLFTSLEEISNLSYSYVDFGGNDIIRPGDVKLLDTNDDGLLNWKDQVEIGSGTIPNWTYGLNTSFNYQNFDLAILFQGSFGYTTYIDLETAPTVLKYENRWTENENSKNSLVPRPGSKNSANWLYSDYRNHNTSYVRLKSMAIGYTLSNNVLKKVKLSALRVYLAGTNLFTLSTLDKYGVDPEAPEGSPAYYYPQQRTVSLGLSLKF